MSTQISPQIKIVAAVGLVLALVLGASMTLMGHSSSSNSAEPAATTSQSSPTATAPTASTPAASATSHTSVPHSAAKPATHARATAKPKATTAPKAAAKPAVKAKPIATPVPLVAANGLPGVLHQLLHIHDIVVVALWDPEIPSDRISLNEAEAGAKDANVGFIAVNVLDDRVAGPLTAAAGNGTLLPSPGVLVYKRPAMLMNTIRGFADRVAVAEAVANAILTDTPPPAATSTSSTTTDPSLAAAAAAATTTP